MSFIETIAPADAQGEIRAMYERQQAAWGFVPNYAKIFSLRPEILARWGQLQAEIRRHMEPRRFELVTLAAALELRSTACALAFGSKLTKYFATDDVRTLALDGTSDALSDQERALVAFARKVTRDASSVTADDVESLRRHGLTDPEIVDLAAAIAGRAFFTKLLDALGVEPDAPLGRIDPALREVLTVGRPVDSRAPQVMPAME
jgi:uncharacterized peroxidase-related enzyme